MGSAIAGIFLHPLRGVNTPYFLRTSPPTNWTRGVKSWTNAKPRQHGAFKMLDCLRKVLFRPTLEYSLSQL